MSEGRAIVWTKQKEDDAWRYCEWKYDDILANNCTLVEATDKAPPLLPPDFTTGTIVMIDMVNSDRKRLGPLQDLLLSHCRLIATGWLMMDLQSESHQSQKAVGIMQSTRLPTCGTQC